MALLGFLTDHLATLVWELGANCDLIVHSDLSEQKQQLVASIKHCRKMDFW